MSVYTYTVSGDFYGFRPLDRDLRLAITASTITATLNAIHNSGDAIEIVFQAPLTPAEVSTLNSLVTSAKYAVDIYANYNALDVKATLHQGEVTLGTTPQVLLAVNSGAVIGLVSTFLTTFGTSLTEVQVVVSKAGLLCNFFSKVPVAFLSVGIRTIRVRVNGVDTALLTSYTTGESGNKTNAGTHAVVPGDLVSIQHTATGLISLGSFVFASISIL